VFACADLKAALAKARAIGLDTCGQRNPSAAALLSSGGGGGAAAPDASAPVPDADYWLALNHLAQLEARDRIRQLQEDVSGTHALALQQEHPNSPPPLPHSALVAAIQASRGAAPRGGDAWGELPHTGAVLWPGPLWPGVLDAAGRQDVHRGGGAGATAR